MKPGRYVRAVRLSTTHSLASTVEVQTPFTRCVRNGPATRVWDSIRLAPYGQLYVRGERESQRLVQRRGPRERDRARGTGRLTLDGCAGARQDAALEAELGRLAHARLDARDGTQLTAKPDLADQGGVGRDGLLAEAGGDGRRDAQIHRRLAEGEAAGDVDIDILVAEREADALGQHGKQHQHAVVVEAVGGVARRAEGGGADKRLHLHQQRARALHADGDGGAAGATAMLGEEERRGVLDIHHAFTAHLEDADLVGGAEAILDAAQQAIAVEALAFQVEHGVHDVLQRPRPGDGALLRDMADDEDRHGTVLGHPHQL